MTVRVTYPDYSAFRSMYPLIVANGSGTVIPAYAVMRIKIDTSESSAGGRQILFCDFPDSNFGFGGAHGAWVINSPIAIPAGLGHTGYASYGHTSVPALKNPSHSNFNGNWGVTADQWYLSELRTGFFCHGLSFTTAGLTNVINVRQYTPGHIFGKNNNNISSGGTGTVVVYGGGEPGSESTTGMSISNCYNYGTETIPATSPCRVDFLNGRPYVTRLNEPDDV